MKSPQIKPIIARIAISIGIAILLGLGLWQLKRMEYKNSVISSLENKLKLPVVVLDDMPSVDYLYQKVKVCGHYGKNKNLYAYYKPDYIILTPFYMTSAKGEPPIMVARGLLPDKKTKEKIVVEPSVKYRCITGVLLASEKKPIFMPQYDGTKHKPLLSINVESANDILKIKSPPMYLMLIPDKTDPSNKHLHPLKMPNPKNIYNNHMEYALTWFILAAILGYMGFGMKKSAKGEKAKMASGPRSRSRS